MTGSFIFVWAAPLNVAQFRNSSNVTMSSLIIHHQISSCCSLSGVACHCALGRSLNTQAMIISAISVAYSPDLSNGATVSTVAAVILNGWRQFQRRSRSSVFPVSPCHLEPVCAVLRVKPRDVCAVLRERSPLPPPPFPSQRSKQTQLRPPSLTFPWSLSIHRISLSLSLCHIHTHFL